MSTASSIRALDGGAAPRGWERLWGLDRWPHDLLLPSADPDSEQRGTLRFDGIAQPWLKEATKRWTRTRLLSGTTFGSMRVYVRDVAIFGDWLARNAPEVGGPSAITRALLEDYLLWVRSGLKSSASRRRHVSAVRQFLSEQAEDGLAGLPRGAVIHVGEIPSHPNACLSCENFLTDASYRPIHEHQLAETQRPKADAERNGQARLVDLLQRDQNALSRILTGLDKLEASAALSSRPGESVDLFDLARAAT